MILQWLSTTSDFIISIYHWAAQSQVWPWLVILTAIILGIASAWITWHFLQRQQAQPVHKHKQQSQDKTAWHSLSIDQVLTTLHASIQGLTQTDINQRQQLYGLNSLPEIKPRSAFLRFLSQFHNLIIYVLLFTAIITLVLGHFVDSGVIFGVVIINAHIGFIQ